VKACSSESTIPAVCRAFIALVVPIFLLGTPAWPQTSAGPLELPDQNTLPSSAALGNVTHALHLNVNMVLVPVNVLDAQDRPVIGLKASAFSVYENEHQREIQYFTTEDSPISIGLVLDLSKSMSDKFNAEREAVSEFFNNANRQDDYTVITVSDRPKLIATAAHSVDAVESSLALQKPDGDTALLDAIWEGADRLHTAQYHRRCLLVISDGGDNHSRHSLRQLQRSLKDSDVAVYAIGIFDEGPFKSFEESMGRRWLSRITDATGGRTVAVDKVTSLSQAAARLSREMRDEYVLGYRPATEQASQPSHRKIKVRVLAPKGSMPLHAYYKAGYSVDLTEKP
jgi:Ca-activated chloride channel family protein